jgi:hypothetical protein
MKTTEHVTLLLMRGRSPKELVEMGFPKSVITRVRRRLRKEKPSQEARASKSGATTKSRLQLALASVVRVVPWQMPDITSPAQVAVTEGLSLLP